MIYNLFFHYRIEKEAGLGVDENGNPCEVYMRFKLGECNTETRNLEQERQTHTDIIPSLADMIGTKPEYIVPITLEEYVENAEDGGDDDAD